ncbi:MAG: patatin-like phospholipase family protein [Christensenellales bacterium]
MNRNYKLALALGSGSARGYAHIGILQVLANHFHFDIMTGSSMGAMIGACYCCGCDLDMMEKLATQLAHAKVWDVSLPKRGFVKGERIQEMVKLLTKNKGFEDIDIPLGIVACDISNGKATVFREGKIHEAVRASMSIPGVFVPYRLNGTLYVDGGLCQRVPVKAAKEMGADFVIGVDVGYCGEPRTEPQNIIETIVYAIDIMGWESTRLHCADEADYIIAPRAIHLSSFAFGQAEEFVKTGREAAETALPEIQKRLEEFEKNYMITNGSV